MNQMIRMVAVFVSIVGMAGCPCPKPPECQCTPISSAGEYLDAAKLKDLNEKLEYQKSRVAEVVAENDPERLQTKCTDIWNTEVAGKYCSEVVHTQCPDDAHCPLAPTVAKATETCHAIMMPLIHHELAPCTPLTISGIEVNWVPKK